jgi:hypothetical protein
VNTTEKAVAILQNTADGKSLAPWHLKLVELAVNGYLSEAGETSFEELYHNATKAAGYTKPWFLAIEHMTRDHEGYVYWKDIRVEHYDHDLWQAPGWQDRMKANAEHLADRCRVLESIGEMPDISSACWRWEACTGNEACPFPARYLPTGKHDGHDFTQQGKPTLCETCYNELGLGERK